MGRRRSEQSLTDTENERLDEWLKKLTDDHTVVGYDPNSPFGFYYIEKNDETDGQDGVPIRRQTFSVMD
jgi:hypothetical protein